MAKVLRTTSRLEYCTEDTLSGARESEELIILSAVGLAKLKTTQSEDASEECSVTQNKIRDINSYIYKNINQ